MVPQSYNFSSNDMDPVKSADRNKSRRVFCIRPVYNVYTIILCVIQVSDYEVLIEISPRLSVAIYVIAY